MQKIVVASGIQIRDDLAMPLEAYLSANASMTGASVWRYPKGSRAKARYEVEVVYTMPEFAKALDTKGSYVIYEGHSRYGQGPAFGPAGIEEVPDVTAFPTNPWGVHFRMGYDATVTDCVDDLVGHSVTPTEYDLLAVPRGAFLPKGLPMAAQRAKLAAADVKAGRVKKKDSCGARGAWRSFDVCAPSLAAITTARGDEPLKGRHFFRRLVGERKPAIPADEFWTPVTVGSADLDASTLRCSVLFMASCSSHFHYFQPLDRRRRLVKSNCRFYLTAKPYSALHSPIFIAQVFKGHDPSTRHGSKVILAALNGVHDSGLVGVY